MVGWELPRISKTGGLHGLSLRKNTGALAHVACVRVNPRGQGQLWSESDEPK